MKCPCLTTLLVMTTTLLSLQGQSYAWAEPTDHYAGISLLGSSGLLRLEGASSLPVGRLALSTHASFTSEHSLLADGGTTTRTMGKLTLMGVPVKGLEIFAGGQILATSDTQLEPHRTIAVGDPFLGVRYGRLVTPRLSLAARAMIQIPSGLSGKALAVNGSAAELSAIAEYTPLPRLTTGVSLTYRYDSMVKALPDGLNSFQRYSANVLPLHNLQVVAGASYRTRWVAPFLELGLRVGANNDGQQIQGHHWLTLGARAWPIQNHEFFVQAGVDVGLVQIGLQRDGARPLNAYDVFIGVGTTFGRKPQSIVKTKTIEVPTATKASLCPPVVSPRAARGGFIRGVILDQLTGKPVRGARIVIAPDQPIRVTMLSQSPDGRFSSCSLPAGPIKVLTAKQGFKTVETVILIKNGRTHTTKISLARTKGASFGVIRGMIRATNGKVLAAKVTIPTRGKSIVASRGKGHFKLRLLTGTFDVLISRKGYVTQRKKIHLLPGEEVILNVELFPKK
jgi:hypothetical protein